MVLRASSIGFSSTLVPVHYDLKNSSRNNFVIRFFFLKSSFKIEHTRVVGLLIDNSLFAAFVNENNMICQSSDAVTEQLVLHK